MAPKKQKRPRFGTHPVGALVGTLTEAAFKRYGFSRAELVMRWPDIVGAELARMTKPERLIRPTGILVLRATTEGAVEAQHMSDSIIASVNDFYGYEAIQRIKLRQAPLPPQSSAPPRPKVKRPAETKSASKSPQEEGESPLEVALARLNPASRH